MRTNLLKVVSFLIVATMIVSCEKNESEVKADVLQRLKSDSSLGTDFVDSVEISYNNGMLVLYDNCPNLIEKNNQKLIAESKKKEAERKRNAKRGVYSWDGFLDAIDNNPFKKHFRFKEECYQKLQRARVLGKMVDGVKEVDILK